MFLAGNGLLLATHKLLSFSEAASALSCYDGAVKLLGFVDNRRSNEMPTSIALRHLGPINCLSDLLLRNVVDELIIAVPMKSCYDLAQRAIDIAERVGVRVVYMKDMYISSLNNTSRRPELFSELVPIHDTYFAAAQACKTMARPENQTCLKDARAKAAKAAKMER